MRARATSAAPRTRALAVLGQRREQHARCRVGRRAERVGGVGALLGVQIGEVGLREARDVEGSGASLQRTRSPAQARHLGRVLEQLGDDGLDVLAVDLVEQRGPLRHLARRPQAAVDELGELARERVERGQDARRALGLEERRQDVVVGRRAGQPRGGAQHDLGDDRGRRRELAHARDRVALAVDAAEGARGLPAQLEQRARGARRQLRRGIAVEGEQARRDRRARVLGVARDRLDLLDRARLARAQHREQPALGRDRVGVVADRREERHLRRAVFAEPEDGSAPLEAGAQARLARDARAVGGRAGVREREPRRGAADRDALGAVERGARGRGGAQRPREARVARDALRPGQRVERRHGHGVGGGARGEVLGLLVDRFLGRRFLSRFLSRLLLRRLLGRLLGLLVLRRGLRRRRRILRGPEREARAGGESGRAQRER
jgi:hypothetical protein